MPFQHLVNYCKVKTPVDTVRIHKASTSSSIVKYKFGIQIPRGIKNAIHLDTKNGNKLWQEAIKTELKQLTDYHTFIVLDSGETVPKWLPKDSISYSI
jgi:C-terminal processing protease CtpA/Prc